MQSMNYFYPVAHSAPARLINFPVEFSVWNIRSLKCFLSGLDFGFTFTEFPVSTVDINPSEFLAFPVAFPMLQIHNIFTVKNGEKKNRNEDVMI